MLNALTSLTGGGGLSAPTTSGGDTSDYFGGNQATINVPGFFYKSSAPTSPVNLLLIGAVVLGAVFLVRK